jgi:SulP family sulfate permease
LIIRLERVPFMDITGIQTLEEVVGTLRKKGVTVLLCEANQRVHSKLVTAGVLASATDESYSASLATALQRVGVLPGGPAQARAAPEGTLARP